MGFSLLGRALRRRLVAALISLPCCAAWGGDVYVVASAGVKLTPDEVREVYLGEKEFSGALRLVPVDNQSLQGEFVTKALSMAAQRYIALWVRKAFRDALNPPQVKANDAEVVAFVRQTPGGIGYVAAPPREGQVSVVAKF
jgi:hypothetical protein